MNVTFEVFPTPVQPARKFWRVLHDWELAKFEVTDKRLGQLYKPGEGWDWRAKFGYPEVQKLVGGHKVPLNEAWQRLSFEMNLGMEPKKWRMLYDDHRAFTDRTGFWTDATFYPEYREAKDYINGIDLQGNAPLPMFDWVRVCGGATVSGFVDGTDLVIETLAYEQCPTWEWLKARPWLYFHAVTCHVNPQKLEGVAPFPQNNGNPVLIPLVSLASREVRFPLAALQEVDVIADPYKVYYQTI